jgi:hypothetical protein
MKRVAIRKLTAHEVNPANGSIELNVIDEPGDGGACHRYEAILPSGEVVMFDFQNGPIGEVGVNGITHEVLLAILEDRLQGFQSGPFACWENAEALAAVRHAQSTLHSRTKGRRARGVEGTHEV